MLIAVMLSDIFCIFMVCWLKAKAYVVPQTAYWLAHLRILILAAKCNVRDKLTNNRLNFNFLSSDKQILILKRQVPGISNDR